MAHDSGRSETYPKLDVLAVGAHPDDLEIGCGGTLARLVQLGYQVGMIDLTDGEPTPGSESPHVRAKEAEAAAVKLGVAVRLTLALPNRMLFDSFESRVVLATEFRRYRPRLVIGLGDKTPLASPDHWQAMQIIDAAVFYSRLTKWDEKFSGTEPHRIDGQIYYRLNWDAILEQAPGRHCVMDISQTLEQKMESILCYASQFPPEKRSVLDRVEAMARQVGLSAGFQAGELFFLTRTPGTRDILQSVVGESG